MHDTMFFMKLRVLLCGWRWTHHRRASWLKAQLRRARHRMSRLARTVHTSSSRLTQYSAPSTQHFLLEPLEARVLLAADLTGVVQSAALIDPAVPTNNASAVVQVQNIGNQRVNQSQVGVYASLDTTLDGADVLLGTVNTGQVNAGQSKNVTVNLTIPNTLDPTAYRLLAKMDNANAIAENSETNNVAVGGTMNVAWKFGTVPGRSGNITLTLKDADGTTVTFSLAGAGLGEVVKDGTNWDLKVTGTTASSAVTILTNGAGNGRVTLNDIHVFGPLSTFLAATTDLTGTLAIDGPVNIPGLSPGTVTLGSIQGGTVAVPSVEALTIVGPTTNAKFYIGTTLGQDGQPGGTGANADTYGVGSLGLFTVTGAMSGTVVRVGIDPVDGTYGNGNDQLIGGASSSIGGIVIGGTLSADTRFYAGAFPAQYLHGLTLKPTAGDFHFVSNFSGPSLTAALQQDTGSSATDKLTNNPTITGSLTDPQGIATFTAGFGAPPTFNILADRQTNGSFALSAARLEQINGGPLTDGPLTVTLRATDSAGNVTQITVPFTLDTQAPVLTVDLDPVSDSTPIGDQQTTNATVTLIGQTEANALVELVGLGRTATADAGGSYTFANVALVTGANTFTVRATDLAGNQRTVVTNITRLSANQPPVLNPIGNKSVDEGAGLRFSVTGSDADVPAQSLIYGATGLPDGATFDPATHEFVWTPTDAQGPGTYDVTFSLSDGVATVSESVTITVTELNQAPVLSPIGNRSAIEGTLLTFDASVADEDVPSQVVTYSLENGSGGAVPVGASIDPSSGVFSWGTTEAQGPGTYTFDVVVTDNGVPALSDRETITVTVTESNLAPGLFVPASVTGDEQSLVTFTAVGTDGDLPANQLTFSLQGTVPDGATIDPLTGVFNWTPTEAQGPGVYDITVRVTDNGVPSAFIERAVRLTIGDANQSPTITSASSVAVPENQTAIMTVTASDADIPAQPLTFSITGGADAAAVVFTTGGALSFVTASNFELPSDANHDNVYEVTVQVSDGAGGIATQNVNVTVTNVVETVPTLSISDVTLAEGTSVSGSTAFNFAVTLSEPVNETVTVQVATSDNGATAASGDYTPLPPTTLTFGPGETTKPVTVQVRQDDRVEGNEQFQVSLSNATNATILDSAGFGTITNDDVRMLSINDVTQTEGTSPSGFTAYTFTVTLSAPTLTSDVTVQVATSDNGATAASGDYTPVPPTTLTFSPNQTEQTITVQVQQDDRVEGNEQFQVSLSNATNATILDGAGFGTIVDDDVRTVKIDDVTVTEGDTGTAAATFTVTLSQASSGTVTVLATTAADSATPGVDYTSNSQTLTFAPGTTQQTFSVPIINDLLLEPTEQFFVNLSNGSGAVVIADAQGVGTILDNDVSQAPALNPIGNQTIDEGQQLTFFANATDPDSPTTFTFSLDNGLSGQVPAGAVIAGGTGLFTWTPTEAQGPGSYTFDVVVTDNGTPALSDRETITVTVNEVSQAPTLQTIPNQTVTAGQLLTFTAVGLDPDIPANGLTYSLEGVVPAGATIDPTKGIFSWTPTNAQIGPQSLTVRVTDNDAPSLFAQQIVSIAVAPQPNQAPVLAPIVGHEVAFEGVETRFTLSATDADSPMSVLGYSATGLPEGATLDALTGAFRWTPTEAQGGQGYQTTFTVTDEQGAQDSQLVAFTVMEVNNFAPIANPDSVPTPLETPVTITAASLLANDTDADNQANGQELAIVRVGAAQFGTLELSTVPDAVLGLKLDTIRYTPNAGFEGVETISYEINEVVDIQAGSPFPHATLDANVVGTLTITVGNPTSANQAPVLDPIADQAVNEGELVAFTATATDPNAGQTLTFSLVNPPAGASIDSLSGAFTWTPTEAQGPGTYSLTLRVTDSGVPALSAEQTVAITVNEVNSLPELLGLPGTTTVVAGQTVTFMAIAADSDIPSNQLTLSIEAGAAALGATFDPSTGLFSWTPTAAQAGVHSFVIRATDNGTPALFAEETVTYNVILSLPPVLAPIVGHEVAFEGAETRFTLSATDADSPMSVLGYSATGLPEGATLDALTGAFRWTPTEAQGGQGYQTTFTVTDEQGAQDSQLVSFIVMEVNNFAPMANPDSVPTPLETPVTITAASLLANDTDADNQANGQELAIVRVGAAQFGTLELTTVPDAVLGLKLDTIRYTPNAGFEGVETIQYEINELVDIQAGSTFPHATLDANVVGTLTIAVGNPQANQSPVLNVIGSQSVNAGQQLTFTATATDADLPAQQLTFSLQGAVPSGAVVDPTTGVFTWQPTAAQVGVHSVTIRVTDNGSPALFDEETFTVTVGAALASSFQGLGVPLGGGSFAMEVSGDGNVIVGFVNTGNSAEAFRWTSDSGMVVLGDLPGGTFSSDARGVSADGGIVVGTGSPGGTGAQAFRWMEIGGMVGLGTLPGANSSEAFDVSADGSVVVGGSDGRAFRYTPEEGMVNLGLLPGGSFVSQAHAVSADGSVIVGNSSVPGGAVAFRWTSGAGMVGLGDLPGGSLNSAANEVSVDGTIVVGFGSSASGQEGFRWTNAQGMLGLGDLPGGAYESNALAVSADGKRIVGYSEGYGNVEGTLFVLTTEAFLWDETNGMQSLNGLIAGDLGLAPGWVLTKATGISADGRVIVGWGRNPQGQAEAWRLVLPEGYSTPSNEAPVLNAIGNQIGNEGTVITFTASATDSSPHQTLDYRLAGTVPAGASINPTTGVFSWTPTEAQGPGLYTFDVVVRDNSATRLEDRETITVTVNEANRVPVLTVPSAVSIAGGQSVSFTATAVDLDVPSDQLTFSLQGTVPTGAAIDPLTGVFTWAGDDIPGSGTYNITVRVTDNGTPTLFSEQIVRIDVQGMPVLQTIGAQSVNEGNTLSITAFATNPNAGHSLTFNLQGSVPPGAGINSTTGVFSWTPTEAQGPGTYQLTVRVTDSQAPTLFDEETFTITVNEVNQAPVLAPIADQTVTGGQTVSFSVSASDNDTPTNQLTYSLEGTVPAGGSIDPQTGLFTWATTAGDVGSYSVTVRATDDGTPALFSEQTFSVTVLSTAASFQGLGDLPGGSFSSRPLGVSGNGAVVVGESEGTAGLESFRWTVGGGIQDLATVVGTSAVGRAASFDGAVIVGDSDAGAFRWSVVDGFQTIVGNAAPHSANAVTADGSVVVGKGQIDASIAGAFRWTAATGAVRLDSLAGYADAEAFGVSADGNVIVGASYFGPSGEEAQAVRWVADGLGGFTVEALGDLPGGNFMSRAVAVSADGTLIFGISESDRGQEAFIWTATGGMQALGDGTGDLRAMSADGSVIVGGSVIWDANNGIRSLSQVFTESGIAGFESWSMSALGVSADGRTIVGEGTNPDGNQEGWRVVLPVNAAAPVFNTVPAGLYTVQTGQPLSFTVSAFDPDGQLVQYRLLGNVPSGVNFLGGDFSWTPTQDDVGGHALVIRAYDSGVPSRHTDSPFTISVTS